MTLPFGTRVARISDPSRIGVIVGIGVRGLAGVQPYTVAWEGQDPLARQTWEFSDGLTVVESSSRSVLRTVTAEAVRDGDWVWGHYRTDDRAIVVWGAPCQKEPHHKTFADRNYILGPDPATLICEAPPAPAEETVWGEP